MYHTIILVGNLGNEPTMRYTPNGQTVATFSVATNRQHNADNGGEPVKETTWFRVTTWGKQAETCNMFLHKGSKVLIEGRLTPDPETGGPRIWSRQDGSAGASYEITATTVRFLSGKENGEMDVTAGTPGMISQSGGAVSPIPDDDIPF
jgi:single-strand DNA-binding protein